MAPLPHSCAPRRSLARLACGLCLLGCEAPPIGMTDTGPGDAPPPIVGAPTLAHPCVGPPTQGRSLAVTTTDFATGALTVVDVAGVQSTPDVALASTDAKPFAFGDYVYLLHRFQIDALDVIDPAAGWTLVEQQAIVAGDGLSVSANPQSIAFSDDGWAYIPLFGSPRVLTYDLHDPRHPRADSFIDLTPVADADGNPEAALSIVCDDTLLVSLQHLDPTAGFTPRLEHGEVALIDRASGRLYDLDADAEGIQGLQLRGSWARQWRIDPRAENGDRLLVLSEGVERIDLATWTSTWLIHPDALADVGITSYLQPQAFALTESGDALYLASYTEDFSEVVIDRFLLADEGDIEPPSSAPERVLSGLMTSEQALEIVDHTLWIGDRTPGSSGVRGFALGDAPDDPPIPLTDTPLATGLPPYALTVVP